MVGSKDVLSKAPAFCSQRWNLAILSFFGIFIVYSNRVNLSVAIICMVLAPSVNVTSDHQANDSILATHGLATKVTLAYPDVTADNLAADDRIGESGCTLEITKSSLYVFTQIPGGWLADRYGGRLVWGLCQSICALSSLALPLAARAHVYLVDALRFLLGFAAGVSFPCFYTMMGRWAPKLERSKIILFCFEGLSVASVLTFPLSALLCVYGFDNGWGSIFYLSALLGSATCIVSAGYMDCSQRAVAVFLVCLSLSFLGLNRGGFLVNHIDLAPRHAGVIYGISNTVATVSGMVGPIIVGSLAPNGTAEEWRHVFYVCAAVSVVGAMVYGVFAEGELQSWAAPPSVQHVVDCHKVKEIENNKNRSYPITQCEDSSPGDITTNNADPMTPRKEGSIITEPQKEDFN
ncbi:hypothetical protein C0Q70_03695 [Pomacea canaliculata]|uniref:Major facilitator superfamily (MFS) profile domain-containing protein n=1 Tax=Pomacea canaliculata TaxID=400727 RepID=A0A2T7PTG9_POMCA|nr:hypothetical protein C0Q70_03695 [Pomacea canaliculata]